MIQLKIDVQIKEEEEKEWRTCAEWVCDVVLCVKMGIKTRRANVQSVGDDA